VEGARDVRRGQGCISAHCQRGCKRTGTLWALGTFLTPSAACCSDTSFSGATTGMLALLLLLLLCGGATTGPGGRWWVRGRDGWGSFSFRAGGQTCQNLYKMTKDVGRGQRAQASGSGDWSGQRFGVEFMGGIFFLSDPEAHLYGQYPTKPTHWLEGVCTRRFSAQALRQFPRLDRPAAR
jgi:hypothetical protein